MPPTFTAILRHRWRWSMQYKPSSGLSALKARPTHGHPAGMTGDDRQALDGACGTTISRLMNCRGTVSLGKTKDGATTTGWEAESVTGAGDPAQGRVPLGEDEMLNLGADEMARNAREDR